MSLKNVILELLMMRDAIQPLGAINTDFGSNFTPKLIAPKIQILESILKLQFWDHQNRS